MNDKYVMVGGHICLDITPTFRNKHISDINEFLSPGKLINVGVADISTGGAVSNTGLAMKILGANVKLVAKIGDDPFGSIVRSKLGSYDADNALIIDKYANTSYTVALVIPGIDRMFLHNPGANDTFMASDITEPMLDGISHFHFGYPPQMRGMYESQGRELISLFRKVKARGISTSLDMAMVDPSSAAGRVDWKRILDEILPLTDVFLPSIEEICFMIDRARYNEWNQRANGKDVTRILDIEKDIKPVAHALEGMGAKVVILKCGMPGMYYFSSGIEKMDAFINEHGLSAAEWCNIEGFEKSYYQPNVVSGTGAGDTSIAAFLTSMTLGYGMEKCVKLGVATGACCISAYDALGGLEPLDMLWKRIEDGWQKEEY